MGPRRSSKKERRSEHRLGFQGVIPGRLRHQSIELRFVAFDISKKGLGILLSPCPGEGEEIALELHQEVSKTLRFKIKHIYGETQGMKRCGLELLPEEAGRTDLVEILSRYKL